MFPRLCLQRHNQKGGRPPPPHLKSHESASNLVETSLYPEISLQGNMEYKKEIRMDGE